MTSLRTMDTGAPTPRAAYHNSGCGPREVFRTPAIGKAMTFDVGETVRAWPPTGEDKNIRGKLDRDKVTRIPPEIIDRASSITLDLLGLVAQVPFNPTDTPSRRALRSLDVLAGALVASGSVSGLVGIARALPNTHRDTDLSLVFGMLSPLEVAATLVTASVFAPPMILWTRAPSFTWWRLDYIIALRAFAVSQHARRPRS